MALLRNYVDFSLLVRLPITISTLCDWLSLKELSWLEWRSKTACVMRQPSLIKWQSAMKNNKPIGYVVLT